MEKKNTESFLIYLIAVLSAVFVFFVFFKKKPLKKEYDLEDEVLVLEEPNLLNSRQEKILSFLEKDGEVTVEVLLEKVGGVTERTLRRDMNKLVGFGIVKKQGNTKGSKYIFVGS